ncbi:Uncharacterised protein [Mycobacterium tuberculosis]|uniref:Uncharacterized protein n=1 Tax=Mycobacterium tuberculosis TaxID=1773 RepID=A0A0T9DX51_MYCTX|nr:Uncharacterised protein [Mycobacterium tuberculosis]CKR32846.1 Uncharacterised protein [Mycobacterium tuberculosis]CKR42781.1 Uncharacterised protein [Mycobacterium tuberculosis]CKR46549.1 Uncharacterised protein [Mycobacterium tuberculosis]CKR74061.1 Uncharacterised protein [Mycobacterium tuberculosis]
MNDAESAAAVPAAPAARHSAEAQEADHSAPGCERTARQVRTAALTGNSQTEAASELSV